MKKPVALKLQVKRLLLSVSFCPFFTSLVLAENLEFDNNDSESQHSLSFEVTRTDDQVDVPTKDTARIVSVEVLKHSLSYSYQLTGHWSMSLSAMTAKDQTEGNSASFEFPSLNSVSLNKDIGVFSSAISYQYDIWSWDLGLSFEGAKTELSGTSKATKLAFQERARSAEIYAASSVEIAWRSFIFAPSVGLAVQKSKIERVAEFSLPATNAREEVNDKDSGGYLSTGVNAAYLLNLDDGGFFSRILWVPSVSVSWSEIVWGEVVSNSRFQWKNDRVSNSSTSAQKEKSEGGSGSYAASLFIILDDYYADLSFSKNFGRGAEGKELSMIVGLDF